MENDQIEAHSTENMRLKLELKMKNELIISEAFEEFEQPYVISMKKIFHGQVSLSVWTDGFKIYCLKYYVSEYSWNI